MGFDGEGRFLLSPGVADPRRDILERSWAAVRIQKRFCDKVGALRMELSVDPAVPRRTLVDSARVCQIIGNLVRTCRHRPNAAADCLLQRRSQRPIILTGYATTAHPP